MNHLLTRKCFVFQTISWLHIRLCLRQFWPKISFGSAQMKTGIIQYMTGKNFLYFFTISFLTFRIRKPLEIQGFLFFTSD